MSKKSVLWMSISLLLMFSVVSCDDSDDDTIGFDDPITVNITALLATTGNSSSFGESCWAALQLAEWDINEWSVENGSAPFWQVSFLLYNTEGSMETALATLEDLQSDYGKIIIGPTTSSEAAYVREYVTDNDILLVSPSSVAISAAIQDDNLFRFVTDDTYQAQAMNAMLQNDDIDLLIPLTRDDVWGNDLLAATTAEFEAHGGVVVEGVKYDPLTEDYTTTLEALTEIANSISSLFPDLNVGVYALTFGEITPILESVTDNEMLLSLPWYGGSAAAKNATLVTSALAAEVATIVGLPCSTYGDNDSEEFDALKTRLETALGREPESYAFAAYDAAWVAARSYFDLESTAPEFDSLKAKFEEICESYVGVTGPVVLNEAGDRKYGNYDFWQVRASGDAFEWYLAARYEIDPETFEGTLVRY